MEMDEQQARTPPPPAMKKMDAAAPGVVGRGGGGDPSRCFLCVVFGGLFFFTTCLTLLGMWAEMTYKDPNYSVAIAAVSGLDPATDLGRRPVLDPEFNITVRAALQSIMIVRPCNGLATTVQVSYHGFQLAWATAPQVCELAGGERTSTTVVARGTRVWLPESVLDSLAADMRSAAGVFDVHITVPNDAYARRRHADDGLLVSFSGRGVGDDGSGAFCDVCPVYYQRTEL